MISTPTSPMNMADASEDKYAQYALVDPMTTTPSPSPPPPVASIIASPPTVVGHNSSMLECNYDTEPSILYQAIEAKQWDYAISLFMTHKQGEQSSTWVVRKETNGKLRWRLLPLHAAVIFGSPIKLVELLLADYPTAAHSKDDQGMLPLHLAFRNESSWDIVEELLTAFPQAVYISDRKARTPLQCGHRSIGGSSENSLTSQSVVNGPESKSFRSTVACLDLYSQIAVSQERQRGQQEARKLAEARVAQMQDSHLLTLTTLKREWSSEAEISKKQLDRLQQEKGALESKLQGQAIDLSVSHTTEKNLAEKLRQLSVALNSANEKQKASDKNSKCDQLQRTNELLRTMVEDLVHQQKDYHSQFSDLMTKYDKLLEERNQVQAAFLQQSKDQAEKEVKVVKNFKVWLKDREKKLSQHQVSLEEEKKVEDVIDFVERTTQHPQNKMTPRPSSRSSRVDGVIDLSNLGSPRDES